MRLLILIGLSLTIQQSGTHAQSKIEVSPQFDEQGTKPELDPADEPVPGPIVDPDPDVEDFPIPGIPGPLPKLPPINEETPEICALVDRIADLEWELELQMQEQAKFRELLKKCMDRITYYEWMEKNQDLVREAGLAT